MPNQIGRWIVSLIDSGVRLAALAFIWFAFLYLVYGFSYSSLYIIHIGCIYIFKLDPKFFKDPFEHPV